MRLEVDRILVWVSVLVSVEIGASISILVSVSVYNNVVSVSAFGSCFGFGIQQRSFGFGWNRKKTDFGRPLCETCARGKVCVSRKPADNDRLVPAPVTAIVLSSQCGLCMLLSELQWCQISNQFYLRRVILFHCHFQHSYCYLIDVLNTLVLWYKFVKICIWETMQKDCWNLHHIGLRRWLNFSRCGEKDS